MCLPARRMYDVWDDPDYDFAETKAERLLLAGLDYSVQKLCSLRRRQAPAHRVPQHRRALRPHDHLLPIGQLSPVAMKKIRVVHVLDGYDKRKIAKDYIW